MSYVLAWAECVTGNNMLLTWRHVITGVGVAVIALGCFSLQIRRADSFRERDGDLPCADQSDKAEHTYLAKLTVVLSLMFLFAVGLAGAANVFLAPCV
jgi:hypothetical protein